MVYGSDTLGANMVSTDPAYLCIQGAKTWVSSLAELMGNTCTSLIELQHFEVLGCSIRQMGGNLGCLEYHSTVHLGGGDHGWDALCVQLALVTTVALLSLGWGWCPPGKHLLHPPIVSVCCPTPLGLSRPEGFLVVSGYVHPVLVPVAVVELCPVHQETSQGVPVRRHCQCLQNLVLEPPSEVVPRVDQFLCSV